MEVERNCRLLVQNVHPCQRRVVTTFCLVVSIVGTVDIFRSRYLARCNHINGSQVIKILLWLATDVVKS